MVTAVAVTPDGARALSGSSHALSGIWYKTPKLWNLATEIRTMFGHAGEVTSVAVTPDGARAISGSDEFGRLKLWDLATDTEIRTLAVHAFPVGAVALTPDGARAISSSYTQGWPKLSR
jgi:WD40 repeat protein